MTLQEKKYSLWHNEIPVKFIIKTIHFDGLRSCKTFKEYTFRRSDYNNNIIIYFYLPTHETLYDYKPLIS